MTTTHNGSDRNGSDVTHSALSAMQIRLWILTQLADDPSYCVVGTYRMRGRIGVDLLQRSLSTVISRHDILRATFPVVDEQPAQRVVSERSIVLPITELSQQPESPEDAVHKFVAEMAQPPFDITKEFPSRFHLLALGSEHYVFVMLLHLIVADNDSVHILMQEILDNYERLAHNQPDTSHHQPLQYADFAYRESAWLNTDTAKRQQDFWLQQLAGELPVLELPGKSKKRSQPTVHRVSHAVEIGAATLAALETFAQRESLDLASILLAAFQILLVRHSDLDEVVVGVEVSVRDSTASSTIGNFSNFVALRTSFATNPAFLDAVREVAQRYRRALLNKDLPIGRVFDTLSSNPNFTNSGLLPVAFLYTKEPTTLHNPKLELVAEPFAAPSSAYWWNLQATIRKTESGLTAELDYDPEWVNAGTVASIASRFNVLLESIAANPELPVLDLPILNNEQLASSLALGAGTTVDYDRHVCIHELIEQQARRTPNAIAASCGKQKLTYTELNAAANRIAHYLRSLDVGPEMVVGICVQRSLNVLLGIIGILKAGGTYVPLDPAYPNDRLQFMLKDSGASIVLIDPGKSVNVFPDPYLLKVPLDLAAPSFAQESSENPARLTQSSNLAYILYTSGSTGQPKGVMIEHRSVINLLRWGASIFDPDDLKAVLASTSMCFDLSVFEMFLPLIQGGEVVIVDNILALGNGTLAREATYINTVPSVLAAMLSALELPSSITCVGLAGEPLQPRLVNDVYAKSSAHRVIDYYGPTETTVYATAAERSANGVMTIGRPVANTQVYILDAAGNPVPPGICGELYIGGDGVARGYHRRASLTALRFVPDAFSGQPGSRLYRTGDVGRFLEDGSIELAGRCDHQVKIRGYRVELGEIEQRLMTLPEVREAVVVAVETAGDDKKLIAFYNALAGEYDAQGLKEFLSSHLPGHMVPSVFKRVDALPRMPNGKIDRRRLTEIQPEVDEARATPYEPKDEVERKLIQLWKDLLPDRTSDPTENFFDCGGHALLAVKLLARINKHFGIAIGFAQFCQTPTVNALAAIIRAESSALSTRSSQWLGWISDKFRNTVWH